jgi:glutamate-1-semialdehyde 2,1-aminomutase
MSDSMSRALFERALRSIPGGVNSPVRAFRAVSGEPIFIQRAEGATLYGADGAAYVDFIGSWGPMILGHAQPDVVRAVQEVATRGFSFGAPTELEVRFAEKIKSLYPSIEMLRCTSSGTEATMSAIRVARGFTKRDFLVKFEGCYHGHADGLLVKAGSGLATFGVPDSGGRAGGHGEDDAHARLQRRARARSALRGARRRDRLRDRRAGRRQHGLRAPGARLPRGDHPPVQKHGAVSIFDEVMTGCRLAPGGAQERFDLRPDMTTLGKIVGGGMPLAVYGGRADIMGCIAPLGPVYQAGTLSGNPLATTAGLTTLDRLDASLYERLEKLGASSSVGSPRPSNRPREVEACVQRVGSMITLFFTKGPVRSWADADRCDRKRFSAFHGGLLERGIYWPPAQFEAAFLSGAHTEADIERTIEAARHALAAATAA